MYLSVLSLSVNLLKKIFIFQILKKNSRNMFSSSVVFVPLMTHDRDSNSYSALIIPTTKSVEEDQSNVYFCHVFICYQNALSSM